MSLKEHDQIVCSQHPANFLSIHDVARLLSVSTRTIRRHTQSDKFPKPIRLNKRLLRWREVDVIRWAEHQQATSTNE